ncbi:MAG: hypothetical protein MRQ10_06085, partial [Candidatus Midichloria mitochondrii]|nr:hypothetical protein [Candidatus Midichloria mitochondrii]
ISTQWWIINYKSYRNFIAHYPEPGTVGCYLSHLKAWEEELDLKFTGVEARIVYQTFWDSYIKDSTL